MPVLPADVRLGGFDEVALGYDEDAVVAEAERCLVCLYPLCTDGCPNGNPIPDFIALVQERSFLDAAAVDYGSNPLAACTGRVCAWERQCEGACVLNVCGEGVRVGAIERFIADYALKEHKRLDALAARQPEADGEFAAGRGVAVVGAGPSGLSCADFLARAGVRVTVFEAAQRAGGLLSDGIPEFVLPGGTVDEEVARLERAGVLFHYGVSLGRDVTLDVLRGTFDGVYVAVGAPQARMMGVPGEDADGIWSAQAFLHRAKLAADGHSSSPPRVGECVLVIGAGNTAMDAARTAARLGARDVRIVYRRTERESPSRAVEVQHAREEGVQFDYLVNPVAFLSADAADVPADDSRARGSGHVRAARLVRMRLGAADESGRPQAEPVPGSEFDLPCDTVVEAVGYAVGAGALVSAQIVDRRGRIAASRDDGHTQLDGVFAGGDAVRGPATVVDAVRDGRVAAEAIREWLYRRMPAEEPPQTRLRYVSHIPRSQASTGEP